MDPVFDAQFVMIKKAFADQGIEIAVAYAPDGAVDYVYQVGTILTRDTGDNLRRVQDLLDEREDGSLDDRDRTVRRVGDLVELSIADLPRGFQTVPEVLGFIDRRLQGQRITNPAPRQGGLPLPLATPNHVLHISRLCSAIEPEVPNGAPPPPCPAPRSAVGTARRVLIGVSDTGLLQNLSPVQYPWLAGVTGEDDPLGLAVPGGMQAIGEFTGHGTFVAGMARCMAPDADVIVNNHFSVSGAVLESVMIEKLEELMGRNPAPDILNLSAGTYSRENWTSLGFETFHANHPDVVLVAAAGNDGTSRPMYPAAYDWVISVGSIGPDLEHRSWFSNFGPTVDVYAPGEGVVNAYATGVYTYREPPKRPAKQAFTHGMARWDGTSFSAPLVAGIIAERMGRHPGESALQAAAAVLAHARGLGQAVADVGPVLKPTDFP
jgi:subtilisin family serine protease